MPQVATLGCALAKLVKEQKVLSACKASGWVQRRERGMEEGQALEGGGCSPPRTSPFPSCPHQPYKRSAHRV